MLRNMPISTKHNQVTTRHGRSCHSGHAFLVAVFALVTLLVIVLGMLQLSGGMQRLARREERVRSLRTLADAGVAFGYWQAIYVNVNLPYAYSRSLAPASSPYRSRTTARVSRTPSKSSARLQSKGILSRKREFFRMFVPKSMSLIPAITASSARMMLPAKTGRRTALWASAKVVSTTPCAWPWINLGISMWPTTRTIASFAWMT